MAGWYNKAAWRIMSGDLNLGSATIKAALLKSDYTPDPDHATMSSVVGASSVNEIDATNYTKGPGPSTSRKAVTLSFGASPNNTLNRVDIGIDDLTWAALGGATNDVVAWVVLYIHADNSNDALNTPLAYFPVIGGDEGYETNGSDLLINYVSQAAGGNLQVQVMV